MTSALTIVCAWLFLRVLVSARYFAYIESLERQPSSNGSTESAHVEVAPFKLIQRDADHNISFVRFPRSLSDRCKTTASHLDLLALVLSSSSNRAQRDSIRKTWANPSKSRGLRDGEAKVYFIVGDGEAAANATIDESNEFDDMIIIDVKDTYKNIVYKVFAILHIAGNLCSSKFTLKIDEDVVFHIDRFLDRIDKFFISNKAEIYCHVYHEKRPLRIEWLEWYVSKDQYAPDIYPDFCSGPAYILTRTAAQGILRNAHLFPDIQVEDVLITGLISQKAGVSRIPYQDMFERNNWVLRKCPTIPDGTPALIAKHNFKTRAAMLKAWSRMSATECPHS